MSVEAPPEGASCAAHPESAASWVCLRCGTFICPACERRVRPEARPMCPTCWDLRSRVVPAAEGTSKSTVITGFVLGVLSLLPFCFILQAGAVIMNLVMMSRVEKTPELARLRWMPIAGLACSGLGFAITLLVWLLGGDLRD
ncbi:hypothetical protein OWM54_16390 [Myxococcus sp. MISCRS1]|uniref:B-box zinc finger protein n=1 Tax=Myxococcus sp. MISCRS1 TaxID=2996786 RepID=UPI0022719705|nr:B-box zinc finger protein [Myxococcus sp. MISCRS1]MCY0998719.1 hypothetical protein [Myxococcus sp. MISCRS1]